jgi:hypothetical protein
VRIYIKENSLIARVAAWKMNSSQIAIVIGRTIHLHNTTRKEFIENKRWLSHEMEHIRQYRKYGFIRFIVLYLVETAKKGYNNNKFEVAARAAEDYA